MKRRLILIISAALLAVLLQAAPASVATPIRQVVTRPAYEVILSAAPSSGTVVELELPAELLRADGRVPLVDRPGQPYLMKGQMP